MEHLIADSGIHFITTEIEFNPQEPLILNSGKALKYSFCETTDFIEGFKVFNLLYYNNIEGKYIPIDELGASDEALVRRANGREEIDEAGMMMMNPDCSTALFTTFDDKSEDIFHISTLQSFMVKNPDNGFDRVPAFELLLDKWLPMPMFRKEVDGITGRYPLAWCRMKINRIGQGSKKGVERFRLVWAFDTQMAEDELSVLRPYIASYEGDHAEYCMCNKTDLLMEFMSSSEEFHAFSDYIASLLGIDLSKDDSKRYKAFYIYFLNYIRLSGGAPEVTLHNKDNHEIFVDLVLDIGNSRTCGILFEESDFKRGKMLELVDLTSPWIPYENKTYDMRVVFRKADFGNDIVLDEEMFQWKSFVRIGDEARRLIYRSLEEEGLSEKTTNYSSPKRYLWDTKRYEGQWENLITTEDPFNVRFSTEVSVPTLSNLYNEEGVYTPEGCESLDILDPDNSEHHYSRASLMTFAFIEIFQHAIAQINSKKYREKWGNIDCRRYIRNIIITCPTAMPHQEQIFLRQSAQDAYDSILQCMPKIKPAQVTPAPSAIKVIDKYAEISKRVWSYDEASCCQLVYLYAEIALRYSGEIHKFFELKGHVRPELKEEGYNNKALTIGTVDIGAGTTDIMVCSYEYEGQGSCKITPTPLFWDSFYLAGDDILRNLVKNIVIEGEEHGNPNLGNISSALTARMLAMTNEQLRKLPCMDKDVVYRNMIDGICSTSDEERRREKLIEFCGNLIHDFFGTNSSMMGYRDRRCRVDFNTQISVPIAQRMMELLKTNEPSKLYTYDDLFADMRPADYLLNHFERHFGFRFEELDWRYDPKVVSEIVESTMEPLMKQLAVVLYAQHCDVIILAGRPTSLSAITELFIKYLPISPDRLIRLNDYRVGSWFPAADGQGSFYDQKAIVAVGGMVGFLASNAGLNGLLIDFSKMIKKMESTANYIGVYNAHNQQVAESLLTPSNSSASLKVQVFPVYLGCRQFDAKIYQARPLYAIYNHGVNNTIDVRISRSYNENKELLVLEDATDNEFRNRKHDLELVQQSLVDNGKHWLDSGEFELTIK